MSALLELPANLWASLIEHLRAQGAGVRESGGFLLGYKRDGVRIATGFVPYEQLQADALNDDFVALTAASFATLWELCRRDGVSVVADVHTHRFGAGQSLSDRTNPMVAIAGHIAFIVPRFAQGRVRPQDTRLYLYQGNHAWTAFVGNEVARRVLLTSNGDTT
jgi:hypothetical protein